MYAQLTLAEPYIHRRENISLYGGGKETPPQLTARTKEVNSPLYVVGEESTYPDVASYSVADRRKKPPLGAS